VPSTVPGIGVFCEGTVNYFQPTPLVTVVSSFVLLLLLPSQPADRGAVTALTERRGKDLRAVVQMLILAHMP